MFQTLKNAWKTPELKSKILFTMMIIVLYRLGSVIPMPWVDPEQISNQFNMLNASGGALSWLNIMSGGALAQATLFALSVSPYITASIVIQLLTIAIPKFEEWAKEGEAGKKKLSAITRGLTVVLALVTSIGYTMLLKNWNLLALSGFSKGEKWFVYIVLVLAYCAGASVIMWLAEKINEHGIGNGISIILFANIIARFPTMVASIWNRCFTQWDIFGKDGAWAVDFNWRYIQWPLGGVLMVLFAAVLLFAVVAVVWFSNSERRIPVQYAKRVVGRKMYGGQATHLPMKVNMSGVLPVIFAQSIASLPATIAMLTGGNMDGWFLRTFNSNTIPYAIVYLLLIIFFAYFYSTIQFNPVEVANNLKKNGGFIPGYRPGKPTSEFIQKVLNKITLFGAIYLGIVAVTPILISHFSSSSALTGISLGGTSIIIVVGVALETVRALEAQMLMRNYKGFLD